MQSLLHVHNQSNCFKYTTTFLVLFHPNFGAGMNANFTTLKTLRLTRHIFLSPVAFCRQWSSILHFGEKKIKQEQP